MKKIKLSLACLFILSFFLGLKAQQTGGFEYERLDSISRFGNLKNILETSSHYYLINLREVFKVDKVTLVAEIIYQGNPDINSSFVDSAGNIGIVCYKKMHLYNGNNWNTLNIPTAIANLNNVMVDFDNNIYLSNTSNDSLFIFGNNNWTKKKVVFSIAATSAGYRMLPGPNHEFRLYRQLNGLIEMFELQGQLAIPINSLHTGYYLASPKYDSSGRIWYLHNSSLLRKNTQNVVDTLQTPNLSGFAYRSFFIDKTGTKIWLSNNFSNDTIHFFNGSTWSNFSHDHGTTSAFLCEMWPLRDDKLADFVFFFNYNGNSSLIIHDPILPSLSVPTFLPFVDFKLYDVANTNNWNQNSGNFENNVLIASEHGLIKKVYNTNNEENRVQIYDTLNSNLPTSTIFCITTNYNIDNDTLYLGTNKGLVVAKLEQDSLIVYRTYNTQNSSLPSDSITAVFLNFNQQIWMGTLGHGLINYNINAGFTHYTSSNSLLPSNHINSINGNVFDDLFVATDSGFIKIHNNIITDLVTPNNSGMINQNISYVKNFYGKTFVGSYGGGLACYSDINKWTYYNSTNLNFIADTVYYVIDDTQSFPYPYFVGTNKGILSISFDNNSNPLFIEMPIWGFEDTIRNYRCSANFYPCGSIGHKFVSLSDKGIVNFYTCLSGVEENINNNHVTISIVGHSLFLKSSLKGKYQLELYSMDGKSVANEQVYLSENFTMNLSPLAEGIYILRLSNEYELHSGKVCYIK